MSNKVAISNLSKEVNSILEQYKEECIEVSKKKVDNVTAGALKVVKKNAPVKTGNYQKHIARKKIEETLIKKVNIIYVKSPQYSLSHLLEHGHLTSRGNRTKSFPHFKYGDEYIEENLYKEVGEGLEEIK